MFMLNYKDKFALTNWCIPTIQGPRSNFGIGGAPLVTQYCGGGGTRHFFLLTPYDFKNIGRPVPPPPPPPSPHPPCSAVPAREKSSGGILQTFTVKPVHKT